ncbi:MAG TPA: diacylglycerol kinase family protein [Opitutaceae bacterium]
MKVAIVHNPNAGREDTSLTELRSVLRDEGHDPVEIKGVGDVRSAPELVGVDLLAVAGGDGTIRKTALKFVGHQLPLAFIPIGTANNISRSLGIAGDVHSAVKQWKTSEIRGIDVGRAIGPWGNRLFLEAIGIGLVGRSIRILETIDERSEREFSDVEDKLQRDLAVFVALAFELPPVRVNVQADGQDYTNEFLLLEILNIRHAGPRIELAPSASPTDGLFDLVMAGSADREELKKTLLKSLSTIREPTFLGKQKARSISLSMDYGELRIDDKVMLSRPPSSDSSQAIKIEISVLPQALRVLLPKT